MFAPLFLVETVVVPVGVEELEAAVVVDLAVALVTADLVAVVVMVVRDTPARLLKWSKGVLTEVMDMMDLEVDVVAVAGQEKMAAMVMMEAQVTVAVMEVQASTVRSNFCK